jgi:hypothetical protein
MVMNLHFPFDVFMDDTDETYADNLKISSLYIYDWEDKNTDDEISSDELSLVNRGGSWGTVQEIRISDPLEKFEHEPVIGVYPVPKIFSFWKGNTQNNSTSMDYTLSTNYYQNVLWDNVSVDEAITIPPNDSAEVIATLLVPTDQQTGLYQGFVSFEGKYHKINSPVTYGVLETIEKDAKQTVISGLTGNSLYGNGYVKGAFDMTSRYMAGDWRQYYFDIQDHTSDWLGTSSFSGGGTFYPLKNKDNTSTVLFAPINQTGTYTLLVHSTLFDGTSVTEPISLAAKFTTIVPDEKSPECPRIKLLRYSNMGKI